MLLDSKNKITQEVKDEVLEMLQSSEDKPAALFEAMEKIVEAQHGELINQIKEEAERAENDAEFKKSLNLRTLSKDEKNFYELMTKTSQAITADQINILPETTVDYSLKDVKEESGILGLMDLSPAGVTKWLVTEKSGKAVWGELFGNIKGELSTKFAAVNAELGKLSVFMLIPKEIRSLALPYVDKYFTAVFKEVMIDGYEEGFLVGNGVNQPIGIYNQITVKNPDGTAKPKTKNALTGFSPKALAPVKKALSNNGLRTYTEIVLICNPSDEADYVAPALYDEEGRMISSYKNLKVMMSANNPVGQAVFVLPKMYTMSSGSVEVREYEETKALDDVNVLIGKLVAYGRAVDDNCAYVIDVTKLEEYVQKIRVVNIADAAGSGSGA